MSRVMLVLVLLGVLAAVTQALALDNPVVTIPKEGAALGPNYDVVGTMPSKAFMIVMTDVVRTDTNEVLRSVPGIRHWTADDGSFHFRAASPRVSIGEKDMPLLYRVRVFTMANGEQGPETVVNCTMAQ